MAEWHHPRYEITEQEDNCHQKCRQNRGEEARVNNLQMVNDYMNRNWEVNFLQYFQNLQYLEIDCTEKRYENISAVKKKSSAKAKNGGKIQKYLNKFGGGGGENTSSSNVECYYIVMRAGYFQ